jgi:hypothetical protein
MKYRSICGLSEIEFRRLTGVHPVIFEKMVGILRKAYQEKHLQGGRKSKLFLEDQMLLTLEYLREYRTFFHIACGYGVSESTAFKIVRWVEDVLVRHPDFALPGKKTVADPNQKYSNATLS